MMIAQAKKELRSEIWEDSNKHYDQRVENTNSIEDNTDAILEIGDLVGEIQEAMS